MRSRAQILDQYDLSGRVAVVTGGSRGIGRAIAETFAAMGAAVVVASRKADACETVAGAITAAGGRAIAVPTHAGRVDQLEALVATTVAELGGLDIVVNNAANALGMPIGAITPEAWESSYGVNLRGPLFLVQHALPHLQASEHGVIVNVISAGAFTHGTYLSMYCSAKAAVLQLTRAMAAELAPHGIRANALAPGTTDTDMVRNNPPEAQQSMVNAALIKRMAAPEELADGALYLASDASSFMTGQCLVIDGGMTTG
ncbi:MAG: glucose 1-dehydrogenase [Actinobacteria bacterium]|nr:glucose 1-dehydrogenase [Actinomycetota bacterium]